MVRFLFCCIITIYFSYYAIMLYTTNNNVIIVVLHTDQSATLLAKSEMPALAAKHCFYLFAVLNKTGLCT